MTCFFFLWILFPPQWRADWISLPEVPTLTPTHTHTLSHSTCPFSFGHQNTCPLCLALSLSLFASATSCYSLSMLFTFRDSDVGGKERKRDRKKKQKVIVHLLIIYWVSVTSLWACHCHGYISSTSSLPRVCDSTHAWMLSMSPCHVHLISALPPFATLSLFLIPSLVHCLSFSLPFMLSRSHLHTHSQPIYTRDTRSNQRIRLFHAHPLTTQVLNCPDSHLICTEKRWNYNGDPS